MFPLSVLKIDKGNFCIYFLKIKICNAFSIFLLTYRFNLNIFPLLVSRVIYYHLGRLGFGAVSVSVMMASWRTCKIYKMCEYNFYQKNINNKQERIVI